MYMCVCVCVFNAGCIYSIGGSIVCITVQCLFILFIFAETKAGNGFKTNGGEKPAPAAGMSSTVLGVCITIGILSVLGLVAASFFVYRRRKKYAFSSCVTTDETSQ